MSSSLLGLETFDWFLGISSPVGSCTEGTSLLSTHWNISNWTNFQKYWEIYTTVGTFINHTRITVLPIISIHSVHLGTLTSLACQVCPPLSHSVFTRGIPAWVRACSGLWILHSYHSLNISYLWSAKVWIVIYTGQCLPGNHSFVPGILKFYDLKT